jgi:hypothetical protein
MRRRIPGMNVDTENQLELLQFFDKFPKKLYDLEEFPKLV